MNFVFILKKFHTNVKDLPFGLLSAFTCIGLFTTNEIRAQWQSCGGPYGGIISSIESVDNKLYAATDGGGVFISYDEGEQWHTLNTNLYNKELLCLKIKGQDIFAGCRWGDFYYSSNSGLSWSLRRSPLFYQYTINSIVFIDNLLLVSTQGAGVFISYDYGLHWQARNNGLFNKEVYQIKATHNKLFAGTSSALFVSQDTGHSWTPIPFKNGSKPFYGIAVLDTFLAVGSSDSVYLSYNNGRNWQSARHLPSKTYLTLQFINRDLYVGTKTGEIYRSYDGGQTWNQFGITPWFGNVYAIHQKYPYLFAGTENTLYKTTTQSPQWKSVDQGLAVYPVGCMTDVDRTLIVGTLYGGVNRSLSGSKQWLENNSLSLIGSVYAFEDFNSKIYAAAFTDVFSSNDQGLSWTIEKTALRGQYVRVLKTFGNYLYAGTERKGIYKMGRDSGDLEHINNGLFKQSISCLLLTDVSFFAGTLDSGVFISKDSGLTWQAANTGLTSLQITAILRQGDRLYIGTKDAGVFRSVDEGLTWLPINSNLSHLHIVALLQVDSFVLLASDGGGISYISNQANEWKNISFGLENLSVSSLYLSDSFIYAGVHGAGLYKLSRFNFETGLNSEPIRQSKVLVYPNPGQGIVQILSDEVLASIEVSDVNGRLVYTKHFNTQECNAYALDLSAWVKGLYYLRFYFEAGGLTSQVLMKE